MTKPAREYTDREGRKRFRGDMDLEIAVDMMELTPRCDHVVLFSGDGDFRCLVEAVQRKGVRVTVVSTVKSQPPMASDDLRRQADTFVDLADLVDIIGRPARDRLPRVPAGGRRRWRTLSRRATARSARGWSPTARKIAPPIPTGSTARRRRSATRGRACWWSAWPPAGKAPTAPGGRSPAITPGCCSMRP